MRARLAPSALRALALLALAAVPAGGARAASAAPARVISLNPSLTAMVLALGAADRLVGVDDFSARQEPAVASLPRVGGLYNPSLEAVVALHPDLVLLVPSAEQRDFRRQLEALGIEVLPLGPLRFEEVLAAIETLGAKLGREEAGRARVDAIRRAREAARHAVAGRRRVRVVLVLQRDPLYVVGSGSFIDEMIGAAGGENVAAVFAEPYPRIGTEWLIEAAPEILIDSSGAPGDAKAFWSHWPSLPAVTQDRVKTLPPGLVTLPGPWLDRAIATLAKAIQGVELAAAPADAAEPAP